MDKAFSIHEKVSSSEEIVLMADKIIFSQKTRFQDVKIAEVAGLGKVLFLDNVVNSAENDEFIYHEMLVHPAMLTYPKPKTVLIIGGSEGAVAREVLKHDVKRVVMVDIDEELVKLCQKHLQSYSKGSYDDPRLKVHFEDGRKYIEETDETFDVILLDLPDPVEDGPAAPLFTEEFYKLAYGCLSEDGVLCLQAEEIDYGRERMHARLFNTVKKAFPITKSYSYMQRSFFGALGFIIGSKRIDTLDEQVLERSREFVKSNPELGYYWDGLHQTMFTLPRYLCKAYGRETDTFSDKKIAIYRQDR